MSINAHPELPEFDYIRPGDLQEASRFLAEHAGEARPLLGGTDIFVRMRDGRWHDRYLVDIKALDGLDEVHVEPGGSQRPAGLVIGAAATMNRVARAPETATCYPALAAAIRSVASYQLRNRATIVGNICNDSPAGDTIGACLALGGELSVHGVDGWRTEALATFFIGPGQTILKPGDVVTELFLPLPPAGSQGAYLKLGRNTLGDLAIVGVTVMAWPDPAQPGGYTWRIVLASVAPVPLPVVEAQDSLARQTPSQEAFHLAAQMAAAACSPIDDVRGSAHYRRAMARQLTEKGLNQVWKQLQR